LASPQTRLLRPLLVLTVFLAVWWLAPVGVRSFSRSAFAEFQAPAWAAYSHLKDLQDFWGLRNHGQDALIAAGRDLARDDAYLGLRVQQDDALRQELERLEQMLRLPPAADFHYEVARVIRRDQNAWWQEIIIRKGRRDGLAPGQGVVYAGGVVGRVKEVQEDTAVVELASSPEFRIAANLGDDPRPVIYEGQLAPPFGAPRGEVRDVPPGLEASPHAPLRAVSSELGGIFPQGLTLGWVEELEPGSDGLFQFGTVHLSPDLDNLHEVAVLEPLAGLPALPATTTPAR
jgi:rod shape-determining protein MreC